MFEKKAKTYFQLVHWNNINHKSLSSYSVPFKEVIRKYFMSLTLTTDTVHFVFTATHSINCFVIYHPEKIILDLFVATISDVYMQSLPISKVTTNEINHSSST